MYANTLDPPDTSLQPSGHFSTQLARSTLIIQKILCSCYLDYRRVWRRANQSVHRTLRETWVGRRRSESSCIYRGSLMIRRILEASRLLRTNWCGFLVVNLIGSESYRGRQFIKNWESYNFIFSGRGPLKFNKYSYHSLFNLFFILFSFIHLLPLPLQILIYIVLRKWFSWIKRDQLYVTCFIISRSPCFGC